VLRAFLFIVVSLSAFVSSAKEVKGEYIQPNNFSPKVRVETSKGHFILELDRLKARITVNNFLGYVARGQYDKTMIHRIEEDYLVQGGGYNADFSEIKPDKPIINESGNGLKNDQGTIAMAKQLSDAHTATSQFFFNLNDNDNLNPGNSWGYAVFGEVIEGYDVLDSMSRVEVGYSKELGYPTVPTEMITIIRMVILDEEK
jgi:peptidyl-prolyl cis-trans isomerase A (cyclophilin A)